MRQAPEGPVLAREVIVIAGPTASGKTELALALARALGGEVVSADSRQVYRGLDAGTAKPARDARGLVSGVACHLLDVVDIPEPYDAGRFAAEASAALADIRARGRVAIVAGGTGLYLKALLSGLAPLPRRDESIRSRLAAEASRDGRECLHARLRALDPEAARTIPANNIQRVIRALEIYELTGKPISSHWKDADRLGGLEAQAAFYIDWPAAALRARIAARASSMWPAMLREVEALASRFTGQEPGFQSLGYREALRCVRGELTSQEGLAELVRSTCAYAKRQRTWFRKAAPLALPGGTAEEMLRAALLALERHETAAS